MKQKRPLTFPSEKNLVPNGKEACRREGKGTDHESSLPAVWQKLAGLLSA